MANQFCTAIFNILVEPIPVQKQMIVQKKALILSFLESKVSRFITKYRVHSFYSFGVCCLFIVTATSDTIDQNCTYIQNPSFPSVYSSQTALTYTINKCSNDVCSVRLDFETFATQGPALTDESVGGTCTDSFVASGTSGITSPVICGSNAGQHSKYFYTSSIIKAITKCFHLASKQV